MGREPLQDRKKLTEDLAARFLPAARPVAAVRCRCGHERRQHSAANGGCWREVAPGRLCLCRKYEQSQV